MFYNRSESKSSIIVKCSLFWGGLLVFVFLFFTLSRKSDIKIPQKEITIKLDIKDKINICLPDEQNH